MAPSLSVALPQYTQDLVNCQVGEMISTLFQAGREPELSVAWNSNILLTYNLNLILETIYILPHSVVCLILLCGKLIDVYTICILPYTVASCQIYRQSVPYLTLRQVDRCTDNLYLCCLCSVQ